MLLYPTFIPNQIHYIMLGIKLGIKIKNFKFFTIRLVRIQTFIIFTIQIFMRKLQSIKQRRICWINHLIYSMIRIEIFGIVNLLLGGNYYDKGRIVCTNTREI